MIARRVAILVCTLSYLCLLLAGAFLGFERVALDARVYDRIQKDLDVYGYVGITEEALPRVTERLAAYLRGDAPDLDIEEEVFGVYGPVFNEREKLHMVDVLNLFRLERNIRTGCLIAGPLLLIAAALSGRKQLISISRRALVALLAVITLAAVGAALLYCTQGFSRLFIAFHHLFFTNDLWLMDPSTDAMIRMLPEGFFAAIAAEAGLSALGGGLLAVAAGAASIHLTGKLIDPSRRK